jgi:hypothetical protein
MTTEMVMVDFDLGQLHPPDHSYLRLVAQAGTLPDDYRSWGLADVIAHFVGDPAKGYHWPPPVAFRWPTSGVRSDQDIPFGISPVA